MSCPHLYFYEGHRSFGSNIPGYAQGAYFPGDEPGVRCSLTNEPCDGEEDCREDEGRDLNAEEKYVVLYSA